MTEPTLVRYRVDFIRRRGGALDAHTQVEGIGGEHPQPWYDVEENIIRFIEERAHTFYLLIGRRKADIVVSAHNGRKYLKLAADGYAPESLLALPEVLADST